ncbi:hypothetical protein AC578_9568 [Pseudocercospora eumusae]|uniref:Uncharacterized protein n=1 Tax=Pseudocercospora eumusae TaxID=321146 RepID=A0A139HG36_9PEZI|nr:hypothetical protein AC578_9568 [Pseudocercospora eumusae]
MPQAVAGRTPSSPSAVEYAQVLGQDGCFGDVDEDRPESIEGDYELGDGLKIHVAFVMTDAFSDADSNDDAHCPGKDLV